MPKISNSRDEYTKVQILRDAPFQHPRCLLTILLKFDGFLSTSKREQMLTMATRRCRTN